MARPSAGGSPDATIRAARLGGRNVARCSLSNNAKQVAPAARHAHEVRAGLRCRARRARRRSPAPARSPAPRDRCVPRASRRAARDPSPSQRANTRRSTAERAGLTSSTGVPGQVRQVDGVSWSPAPSPRAARLSRQAGTSPPSDGATGLRMPGSMSHSDVSSRSAAAASAEPPPIPAATGSFLSREARAGVAPAASPRHWRPP